MKSISRTGLGGAALVALLSVPACLPWEMTERGAKFGINFAKLKNGVEWDKRTAIAAGYFMSYEVNDRVAFQPEILFSLKGGEISEVRGGGPKERTVVTTTELSYIDWVGLAKYTVPTDGGVKPIVFGGLSLGMNIGDDVTEEDPREGTTTTAMGANFFELELVLGAGAEFALSKGRLAVDIRLGIGLTKVADEELVENKVTTIMVGYAC